MTTIFTTKQQLIEAIDIYCGDKEQGILKYGEMNSWNVSNITDMSSLFYNTLNHTNFNEYINDWDVSNVTNMDYLPHARANGGGQNAS